MSNEGIGRCNVWVTKAPCRALSARPTEPRPSEPACKGSDANWPWDMGSSGRSVTELIWSAQVLAHWRARGHRALLFTQTQQMLDILERSVQNAGMAYHRMDGSTAVGARARLVDDFNDNEAIFVFLLTTKVGGIGINLTGADRSGHFLVRSAMCLLSWCTLMPGHALAASLSYKHRQQIGSCKEECFARKGCDSAVCLLHISFMALLSVLRVC